MLSGERGRHREPVAPEEIRPEQPDRPSDVEQNFFPGATYGVDLRICISPLRRGQDGAIYVIGAIEVRSSDGKPPADAAGRIGGRSSIPVSAAFQHHLFGYG
ncbi:MAG: hypothetical protein J2P31_04990 [Blastocatellia bacterium]|nr:hypothetical protein [Blastocatellia bacterium]